jgi:hypothetical protein
MSAVWQRLRGARLLGVAGVLLAAALVVLVGPALNTVPNVPQAPTVPLSAEAIRDRLAAAGFADLDLLKRRGPNYTARARLGDGPKVHLVIHGQTGAILGLTLWRERRSMDALAQQSLRENRQEALVFPVPE